MTNFQLVLSPHPPPCTYPAFLHFLAALLTPRPGLASHAVPHALARTQHDACHVALRTHEIAHQRTQYPLSNPSARACNPSPRAYNPSLRACNPTPHM
mmetsp:Transcript_65251/g.129128  ORF Transcript_65251/g.129128 Transcript_65251/m.129128 type:complete len:98 (-) Transcript_65251:220-513(-)